MVIFNQALLDARIAKLHDSPWRAVITCTGAGAGIQNMLWGVPNTSATLLRSGLEYDRFALQNFIEREPEKYCSMETALMLANASLRQAQEFTVRNGVDSHHAIGIGLTAAVETGKPKRGEHQVFIAARTPTETYTLMAVFEKGRLGRRGEGTLCDLLAIEMLLDLTVGCNPVMETSIVDACGMKSLQLEKISDGTDCHYVVNPARAASLAELDPDVFRQPLYWPDGRRGAAADLDPDKHILFPGSFRPKHFGHDSMASQAEATTGKQAVYCVTNKHPDKGELGEAELLRRAEQFRWHRPILCTQDDSLYVQKAEAFPHFDFLIGVDALLGLLNPKYYGGVEGREEVLKRIVRTGAKFKVVGREIEGKFVAPSDVEVPLKYSHVFQALTGRWNVASRNLR